MSYDTDTANKGAKLMAVTVVTSLTGRGGPGNKVVFENGALFHVSSDGHLAVNTAGNNKNLAGFAPGSWIFVYRDDEAVATPA